MSSSSGRLFAVFHSAFDGVTSSVCRTFDGVTSSVCRTFCGVTSSVCRTFSGSGSFCGRLSRLIRSATGHHGTSG